MNGPAPISPEVSAAASTLPMLPLLSSEVSAVTSTPHIRLDPVWHATKGRDGTVFPAMQLLTIKDKSSPADGAGMSVPVDAFSLDTLRTAYEETVAKFATAA